MKTDNVRQTQTRMSAVYIVWQTVRWCCWSCGVVLLLITVNMLSKEMRWPTFAVIVAFGIIYGQFIPALVVLFSPIYLLSRSKWSWYSYIFPCMLLAGWMPLIVITTFLGEQISPGVVYLGLAFTLIWLAVIVRCPKRWQEVNYTIRGFPVIIPNDIQESDDTGT